MTAAALLALLGGYVVMSAIFVGVARRSEPRVKWLGIAIIALAAPFFFWLGAFTGEFGAGQCYSEVIGRIATAADASEGSASLGAAIRALPMQGYETVCGEVERASRTLPGVSKD